MEEMVTFFLRYAWAVFIGLNILNSQILWARVQGDIRANPALAHGYRTLTNGYAFWMSIPWAVMGVGIVVGGVANLSGFLPWGIHNPYVLAFWLSIVLVYFVASGYWLFMNGGIEMLIQHPAVLNTTKPVTGAWIKMHWLLLVVSSIAALIAIQFFNLPFGPSPR